MVLITSQDTPSAAATSIFADPDGKVVAFGTGAVLNVSAAK